MVLFVFSYAAALSRMRPWKAAEVEEVEYCNYTYVLGVMRNLQTDLVMSDFALLLYISSSLDTRSLMPFHIEHSFISSSSHPSPHSSA